ncbi:MAG: hypothetical protein ACK5XN_33850 [Bacteroidota bacterium]
MSELKVNHDKAIDYTIGVSSRPYYSYIRQYQTNGQVSPPVALASTSETQFEVPSNVINFSQCSLDFQLTIPAQGGGGFGAFRTNFVPFQRVYLMTRQGQYLVDIPDMALHWKLCANMVTTTDEFYSYPSPDPTALSQHMVLFNNPSNILLGTAVGAGANHPAKISTGTALDNDTQYRKNYLTENEYIISGDNSPLVFNCRVDF